MASRVVGGERLGLNVPSCSIEMAQRAVDHVWARWNFGCCSSRAHMVMLCKNILTGDRCNIATTKTPNAPLPHPPPPPSS